MGFLAGISEEDATGATRGMHDDDLARLGYIANYTKAFATRPAVYAAWHQLVGAITGQMDPHRYEVITLAAARQLRSSYCALAHGKAMVGLTDEKTVVAMMRTPELLDPTDAAVFELATKIAGNASSVTKEDLASVRGFGLTDSEILDIVLATAARCFFITVLDGTGTQPDAAYRDQLSADLLSTLTVGRPIAQ